MTITELLTEHRNYYLNQFKDFQQKSSGATELLLEMKNDEPEEIYRLYRYDLVQNENGEHKISEFNTDGFLNHDEIQFNVQNKELLISPIVWNGVEILISNKAFDLTPIVDWAYKWLDASDDDQLNSDGLTGKIHNLTKPMIENDWLTTSVDFGTAPVTAAIELIEIILSDSLTTSVKLQSKWMTE